MPFKKSIGPTSKFPVASRGSSCEHGFLVFIGGGTRLQCSDSSFWKYKVYADIRRGSCWRGPQMRLGWLTTTIFGDLSGYFFGNFRDKASDIISRYATPCWPVTDCKSQRGRGSGLEGLAPIHPRGQLTRRFSAVG